MSFLNGTDPGLRQIRAATTDNFAAGVDFTAGSSTSVTLTNDPGSEDNLIVTFDGVTQHRNTYTVSGAVVTFDAAIGSGVSNVEATYTTTIPAASPADNSVTLAKLSDGTQGGLIYYAASGAPTELAAGTSGQYLQTQGAGANPQWASVTASGWEFVSSQTASSSATIDFTGFTSGYDYEVTMYDVLPASDAQSFLVRFGTGAGPTYSSGSIYQSNGVYVTGGTVSAINWLTGTSFDPSVGAGNVGPTEEGYHRAFIPNPAQATAYHGIEITGAFEGPANDSRAYMLTGQWQDATAVTAVRFFYASGNIATGEFTLFRRANA